MSDKDGEIKEDEISLVALLNFNGLEQKDAGDHPQAGENPRMHCNSHMTTREASKRFSYWLGIGIGVLVLATGGLAVSLEAGRAASDQPTATAAERAPAGHTVVRRSQ